MSVRQKELIILNGSDGSEVGLGSLEQVNVVMTNYFFFVKDEKYLCRRKKNEVSMRRRLETK